MFKKVRRYLKSPYYALGDDLMKTHPHWMSDKYFIKVFWKQVMGYPLDLKHPRTFNEKLQWLKLYDRNPIYTDLVDKLKVKDWVAERIGREHVIPTLAVYDRVEDIHLEDLPEQFVLKCNHDSGGVVICKDKSTFDFESAKRRLKNSFEHNFYWDYREWVYKNVERKVFAEQFVQDASMKDEMTNFKVFGTEGEPKIIQVSFDRFKWHKRKLYDKAWNHLESHIQYLNESYRIVDKPAVLEELLSLVSMVSKKYPQVKTDCYLIDDKVYFGEMTFCSKVKYESFAPELFGVKAHEWIEIVENSRFVWGWMIAKNGFLLYAHSESKIPKFVGLKDYKFFCFGGIPKIMYVANDRDEFPTMDFYDMDYVKQPLYTRDPPAFTEPPKPRQFEMMKHYAASLSEGIPQVRVDFYENDDTVFFGEMTFYHSTGFSEVHPYEWNLKMGDWIQLPEKRC